MMKVVIDCRTPTRTANPPTVALSYFLDHLTLSLRDPNGDEYARAEVSPLDLARAVQMLIGAWPVS